jgi:lipid II:glycine glycyltransferase (peptidoglycan interpeptide bridge formation enzyme)
LAKAALRSLTPDTHETFFSQAQFIRAVAAASQSGGRVLKIPVSGCGPEREMYALEEVDRCGRRTISLGPFGLYASPGWNRELHRAVVKRIVSRLTGIRTKRLVWTVRFDHRSLAEALTSCGLKSRQHATHVLPLDEPYDRIFSRFTATIRNQIRRACREGVTVEEINDEPRLREYYTIYEQLADAQRRDWRYPFELFQQLLAIRGGVRILAAFHHGRMLGGGVFIHDGCSERYWHGAAHRDGRRLFPTCAILDRAIRDACANHATFFGFGGSIGKPSLEQFKTFWGARREAYWEFEWQSPLWARVSEIKGRFQSSSIGEWLKPSVATERTSIPRSDAP